MEYLDGNLIYMENVFGIGTQKEALNVSGWKQEQIEVYGKTHNQPRLTQHWGIDNPKYRYSKKTFVADQEYPPYIQTMRNYVLKFYSQYFEDVDPYSMPNLNYCLGNYYRNGNDKLGYHADDEGGIVGAVVGVSFGSERDILFKHNVSREVTKIPVRNNSLMIMLPEVQKQWKHAIPMRKRVQSPRVSYTFRTLKNYH